MKKNYYLPFTILSIFLWMYLPLPAQRPQAPTTALSPNAASLGLYGDIPVSHYTGVPNIEIPLYQLNCHGFDLPISLSYHASGVRPDQRPGWVGLGWNLNAGGIITRNYKDLPDESNNKNYYLGAKAGYYYNYEVLNTTSWNQWSYLRQIAQSEGGILKDTEPDEFSFNFLGYSGKFYLNHTGNWAVQCNKPVKVIFDNTFLNIPFNKRGTRAEQYGYSPSFSGFTIIGEDGTQYLFGGNTNAIEYSIDFFGQSTDDWTATSWYLTKIILPNKQEITFAYDRGDFINQMYIAIQNDLGSYTESSGGIYIPQPSCSSQSFSPIETSYKGKMIAPSYLWEIKSNDNVITFSKNQSTELNYNTNIYNSAYSMWQRSGSSYFLPILENIKNIRYPDCLNELKWYKLNTITVKDNSGKEIKSINFTYNNLANQRLILLNVTESGKNPYKFGYTDIQNLPPYLANKTDHWGFYNGTYASYGTYNAPDYVGYYSKRNPNASYLKYGTINKITYPTGGYTEFEFEPHQYRKQLSLKRWESCSDLGSNNTAGGLRVKKISDFSGSGIKSTTKEYFYVSDYLQNKTNATKSSGVLGGQIQYYFTDYIVYAFNDKGVKRKMSSFSSFSVLPSCLNANGCHVGYTEVIEKREDNAFSRYVFTNFDNGYMDEPADAIIQLSRTPYEPYASKDQERGNLIEQEDYNSGGVRVKNKTLNYEKDNSSTTNYVRAMNALYRNICSGTAVSYDEGTSYKIYTYRMRPKSETETYYTSPSSHSITTNYAYNGQKLVQSVSSTNSDGSTHSTDYKYPSDYNSVSPYKEMVLANILSPVVMKSNYKNGVWLSDESSDYSFQYSRFYKPANLKLKQNNSTAVDTRETYKYDDRGNVREIIKDNSDKVVYLWGYNYQYPIAKIQGATYDEVKAAIEGGETTILSLASSASPDISKVEALRNAHTLYKALITTYTYKQLVGMESMTNTFGVKTRYEYDSAGRLTKVSYDGQTINTYQYNYRP